MQRRAGTVRPFPALVAILLLPVVLAGLFAAAFLFLGEAELEASSHISVPFTDDVEDAGANYWLADSPWARTNADSKAPTTPGPTAPRHITATLTRLP